MKILITGADGQLGRALHAQFLASGLAVVALNRAHLDITDVDAVNKSVHEHQPEFVINAAGFSSWTAAQQKPAQCYSVTRDGAGYLAAACAQQGAVMVQFSSDHVFVGQTFQAIPETELPSPQSVLGNSQLEAEQRVRELCDEHLIIRSSGLFSGYGNNIITQTLQTMRAEQPIAATQEIVYCPTFVDHLAIIVTGMLHQVSCRVDPPLWGTYHYCDKQHISHFEFVQSIVAQAVLLGIAPAVPVYSAPASTLLHWPNAERFSVLATHQIFLTFGVRQRRWRLGLNAALQNEHHRIVKKV